MTDAELQE